MQSNDTVVVTVGVWGGCSNRASILYGWVPWVGVPACATAAAVGVKAGGGHSRW